MIIFIIDSSVNYFLDSFICYLLVVWAIKCHCFPKLKMTFSENTLETEYYTEMYVMSDSITVLMVNFSWRGVNPINGSMGPMCK